MQHDYTYYYISSTIVYVMMLLCTFVIFKNWRYIRSTKEWIFLPFLCVTIAIELVGLYYVWVLKESASSIMDLYKLVAMLVAIYWFYTYLKYKWLAIISSIVMIASYLLSIYYIDNYNYELPAIVIAAALIITLNVFLFFNKLLHYNEVNRFKNHRSFWITIGLFVFHINAMPFILFLPNLSRLSWQVSSVLIFINLIMYGSFIYALRLKPTLNE
jgi:hypothetical protein